MSFELRFVRQVNEAQLEAHRLLSTDLDWADRLAVAVAGSRHP
jgi:hypothetical protein